MAHAESSATTSERQPRTLASALPWVAALLLLTPAFVLPPVPIDETRYIGVAWHMHETGRWLVPYLNGQPYPDKPPLLFWLINGVWALTGVHAWSARLLNVVMTGLGAWLLRTLAGRLGGSAQVRSEAVWVWLGSVAVIAFSNTIMFDGLLTACTLGMWLGGIDLTGDRGRRRQCLGMLLTACSLGLGILAKGPVALLVGGLPLVLTPWWSADARRHLPSWLCGLLVALAGGVGLALAWALPAASAGGPAYADAIFLKQTVGRVADSFAHQRPIWWYLPVLPVLLLPWLVSIARSRGPRWAQIRPADSTRLLRLCIAAFAPAFIAFCLISGKQPHYLLPLLPALALPTGLALAERRWRISPTRAGAVLVLIGIFTAVLAYRVRLPGASMAPVLWGLLPAISGVALAWRRARPLPTSQMAVAMMFALLLSHLAALQAGGARFDITPAARRIAYARVHQIPVASAGRHHGMYDYAGRLHAPVPYFRDRHALRQWAAGHPNGWVISSSRHVHFTAHPLYRQPYLLGKLSIWRVRDLEDHGDL